MRDRFEVWSGRVIYKALETCLSVNSVLKCVMAFIEIFLE